jgi:hypothetical protein
VREIRTLRATGRGLETQPWRGLRHRQKAKAAGNSYSPLPVATAPALDPTGWLEWRMMMLASTAGAPRSGLQAVPVCGNVSWPF